MNKITRYILAIIIGFTGLALFFVKTDRAFVTFSPIEGQTNAIVLESGQTYAQTFPAIGNNISRVSVFLRPAAKQIPEGEVPVSLAIAGQTFTQKVPTAFIDSEGAAQARFTPPLRTAKDMPITLTLQVPDNLSGQIRAQVHEPGEFAYQVYSSYTPSLAIQIGGLLLLAALITAFPPAGWKWVPSPAILLGAIIVLLAPWPLKALAILAAPALHALHRFLGRDRLVTSLMYLIVALAFLELMHLLYE